LRVIRVKRHSDLLRGDVQPINFSVRFKLVIDRRVILGEVRLGHLNPRQQMLGYQLTPPANPGFILGSSFFGGSDALDP
jgi:hypothetical protein